MSLKPRPRLKTMASSFFVVASLACGLVGTIFQTLLTNAQTSWEKHVIFPYSNYKRKGEKRQEKEKSEIFYLINSYSSLLVPYYSL